MRGLAAADIRRISSRDAIIPEGDSSSPHRTSHECFYRLLLRAPGIRQTGHGPLPRFQIANPRNTIVFNATSERSPAVQEYQETTGRRSGF